MNKISHSKRLHLYICFQIIIHLIFADYFFASSSLGPAPNFKFENWQANIKCTNQLLSEIVNKYMALECKGS